MPKPWSCWPWPGRSKPVQELMIRSLWALSLLAALWGSVSSCQSRRQVIYLVSFGGISEAQVQLVQQNLERFYGRPVRRLASQRLSPTAQCPVRHRPRAARVLEQLQALLPDSVDSKIIGLTTQDVEIERPGQPHWGVMGLANHVRGEACVVSTFRLGGKPERLRKVSLHEIGHLMNLPHCTSGTPTCFMQDARGLGSVVDRTRARLCPPCQARVAW